MRLLDPLRLQSLGLFPLLFESPITHFYPRFCPSAVRTFLTTLLGLGYKSRFVFITFSPSNVTLNSPRPPLFISTSTFSS